MVPRRALTDSELGRDFSVKLDMISTASDVEIKAMIARPMTLWIQQANLRFRSDMRYWQDQSVREK
ncbi:phage late control D family protein [Burkholderia gladioli]|nr:phage late control D family protein [Burkholderia gladioli]URV24658.1 phage late control D family protein [Burkholderia gladioli]